MKTLQGGHYDVPPLLQHASLGPLPAAIGLCFANQSSSAGSASAQHLACAVIQAFFTPNMPENLPPTHGVTCFRTWRQSHTAASSSCQCASAAAAC